MFRKNTPCMSKDQSLGHHRTSRIQLARLQRNINRQRAHCMLRGCVKNLHSSLASLEQVHLNPYLTRSKLLRSTTQHQTKRTRRLTNVENLEVPKNILIVQAEWKTKNGPDRNKNWSETNVRELGLPKFPRRHQLTMANTLQPDLPEQQLDIKRAMNVYPYAVRRDNFYFELIKNVGKATTVELRHFTTDMVGEE
ncbi:hypothetical protein DPMN_165182 [Dreissena polymorpha]|uniref:Uncharacterized protein n=1 Tax=Dreissena polymorpha TaxID=45954 RepID=A0A9D4EX68_DREPO|nr:hypothetical protein DPMN_165182 [Dreissena polymorpha]